MLITLALLAGVSALAFAQQGVDGLVMGVDNAWHLVLRAAPFLSMGIALAGMLTVLFPPAMVGRWMGDDAGVTGLAVGMVVGMLSPGGPYVVYPVAASLLASGAGVAPLSGFLAARNLITANRTFVWEIPFLGVPLTVSRIIASLWFPIVAVVLVPLVFRMMPERYRDLSKLTGGAAVISGQGKGGER
jgi:uncharacterized membrane protein YraQ (UPF0718 family)